jgi:hypothetical protein
VYNVATVYIHVTEIAALAAECAGLNSKMSDSNTVVVTAAERRHPIVRQYRPDSASRMELPRGRARHLRFHASDAAGSEGRPVTDTRDDWERRAGLSGNGRGKSPQNYRARWFCPCLNQGHWTRARVMDIGGGRRQALLHKQFPARK